MTVRPPPLPRGQKQGRLHQRFRIEVPVEIRSRSREEPPSREERGREDTRTGGVLVDVGVGGAACELHEPLRLGEPVTLVVGVEPGVEIAATVAWVGWGETTAARVGLRFADEETKVVLEVLERLAPASDVGT